MKTTFAILALFIAVSLKAAVVPEEIRGTWVVTGYRLGGISALSEKEAEAWIGRSMTIGQICVSLEGKKIHLHHVGSTEYDTETYFWDAFRIKPTDIGYTAPRVRTFLIAEADEEPWIEPGGSIAVLSRDSVCTVWDGVLYLLERKKPNQAAQTTPGSCAPLRV